MITARPVAPRVAGRARCRVAFPTLALGCLLLAACSAAPTPPPTRLVQPPTLVVITPTIITGGVRESAPAPTTAPVGPLLTPPARAAPPLGVPTQIPAIVPPAPSATMPRPAQPTPAPDPNAPRAVKLTPDGCCPEPSWLPDGAAVAYYGMAVGQPGYAVWAIPSGGGAARLVTTSPGTLSPDGQLVAYPDGATTRVARLDGTVVASWETNGRLYFAPRSGRAAWFVKAGDVEIASPSLDPPVRVAVGVIATGAVATLPPAFSAERLQWFPDGRHILIAGREGNGDNPGLWVLDTDTGVATRIVAGRGLEQPLIAPDGKTIAYTATLQEDRAANGVWLVAADGGNRRRAPVTGGYRWSPDSAALYYVPLAPGAPTDELWRYRLADGSHAPVVGARRFAFRIAQDEWAVAPTGDAIAYRSADDGAIWVVTWVR